MDFLFKTLQGPIVLLFVVLVSWEHYEHFFFSIHTNVAKYSSSIKNDHCHYTQQNIHFISVCTFSSSQMINCRGRTVANVKLKTIRMTFTIHNSLIFEECKSESRYAKVMSLPCPSGTRTAINSFPMITHNLYVSFKSAILLIRVSQSQVLKDV